MKDEILDDIVIRLKLINAFLKSNELNQANEYLMLLTDKYEMSDLTTIKSLINSNEIINATLLIEQVINSYENITRIIKSVTKPEVHIVDNVQTSQDTSVLISYKENNKWGFKDLNNKLIIDCIYDDVYEFQEGKAAVKKDGNWGFINTKGEICSDFIYERVESYYEGMAAVCTRSTNEYCISENHYRISEIDNTFIKVDRTYFLKWGFINHEGVLVIPFLYSEVKRFSEGLAMVESLVFYTEGMSWFEKEYKYEFIDKTGNTNINLINVVSHSQSDFDWFKFHNKPYLFIEGRCKISVPNMGGKLYGTDIIINKSGDIILSNLNYDMIKAYSEGLSAVAKVTELVNSEGYMYFDKKWGFVDINGNEVINCKFDNVGSFWDGLAPVCLNRKWGFINKNGVVIISCKFHSVRQFSEGLAAAYQEVPNLDTSSKQKKYKWGFIDKTGKTVIPYIYDGYSLSYEEFIPGCNSFKNGRVSVKKNSKWYTINKQGDIVEEC